MLRRPKCSRLFLIYTEQLIIEDILTTRSTSVKAN